MNTHWILASLTAGMLLPGTALAGDTSVDFDRNTDFSRFRTYAVHADTITDNPLVDRRLLANIDEQLAAKGLEKTTDNPDLTVIPRMSFEKSRRVYAYSSPYFWPYGWGYGWYGPWYAGWGWGGTDVVVKDVVLGKLTIDLVDTTTNAVVWRGTSVKTMSDDPDGDKLDKRVRRGVVKVFRKYPPDPDDDLD